LIKKKQEKTTTLDLFSFRTFSGLKIRKIVKTKNWLLIIFKDWEITLSAYLLYRKWQNKATDIIVIKL